MRNSETKKRSHVRQLAVRMAALTGIALTSAVAPAAVLSLDFGSSDIGTAAGYTTYDPYHATSGDAGNLTWNVRGTSDVTSDLLKWGNNTTATGVRYDLGVTSSTPGNTLVVLGTQPGTSGALGNIFKTGIYGAPVGGGGTSPARDGVYTSSTSPALGVAMQVNGLAAGTYDIYYVGRNTNTNNGDSAYTYTQTMHAGVSASPGNFNYSGYASDTISYATANTQTANWLQNGTYAKLTMTLAAGQRLNMVFTGAPLGTPVNSENRGFLNSLQIVSVPEPASLGALGAIGALAMRRRRAVTRG